MERHRVDGGKGRLAMRWFPAADPGPCPVDDAPHTTCCAPEAGPIVVQQMPARDAYLAAQRAAAAGALDSPTAFTTATYRRKGRA